MMEQPEQFNKIVGDWLTRIGDQELAIA